MLFGKSKNKGDSGKPGILSGLQAGLSKTRSLLLTDIRDLFGRDNPAESELLDELEAMLLTADVGVESTAQIIGALKQDIKSRKTRTADEVLETMGGQMVEILKEIESPLEISKNAKAPYILLVVGVNGAGKTTTIGKLANLYKKEFRVLLVAGDTFRAAAIEQLSSWGEKNDVPVVSRSQGSDSAAVIYDGLAEAKRLHSDIVIADTAGRLQNKNNLLDELKKIRRTINKFDPELPVESLLVLDAGNGQNALVQARQFNAEIGISGIVLTKLDGTAKGGIVFAIASKLGIPLRYIGTGEGIDDIAPFRAREFVTALLNQDR